MKDVLGSLKAARKARGWSTTYVGQQLGLSQQAISSWERGAREPTWADLQRWADLLGLRVAVHAEPADGEARPDLDELVELVRQLDPDAAKFLLLQVQGIVHRR